MKNMKKAFALLLALVLVLGLSLTAVAASDGSITIENATVGQTYTIYKVFDLTYVETYEAATYNANSGETYYTYDENSETYIVATDPENAEGQLYVKVYNVSYTYTKTGDNDALYTALTAEDSPFTLTESVKDNVYNVSLKEEGTTGADIAAFLKGLVEAKTLTTTIKSVTADSGTVKFENLDYGYYYIETTLGTAVTVDSTMPDVTVKDKNEKPETTKQVEEDSTKLLGEKNTADIGDKVKYTTTISAQPGAENYVLHDTMTEGLDFNNDIVVKVGDTSLTAYTEGATSWDYEVVTPGTETGEGVTACTFEIVFNQTYLDAITESTTITVTYSATVNDKAVIDGDGNTNKTHLSYGENSDAKTTEKTTTTYVFDVDILKYTAGENDTKTPLSGAEFVLYKTVDGTNYYAKVTDGKLTGWTKNSSTECEEDTSDNTYATTLTSGEDGKISVDGLDADTYYLEETKAPDGYNLLEAPVEFKIDDEGNVSVKSGNTYQTATNGQIDVENKTGSELPQTGGIGTTIFYVVGSILVVGAAVLLITKKRMSGSEK